MCRAGTLSVRSYSGEVGTINMFNKQQHQQQLHMTVQQLKELSLKTFPKSGSNIGEVKLIVRDMPLDNDSAPLCQCGVKPGSDVVQMVRKVSGG